MSDVVTSLIAMLLLAAALFLLARRFAQTAPRPLVLMLAGATLAHLVLFLSLLWDNVLLARLMPWAVLPVTGNWQPALVGVLAGLASGVATVPAWRRALLTTTILSVGLWKAYAPLLGGPPAALVDRWATGGVCLQSSEATCSPAAAATLLRAHGIDAGEAEMAELCLTSARGTTMHGLYRGLKLKTRGTPWDVEVFRGDAGALQRLAERTVLLTVGLRRGEEVDPRYEQQWGWPVGLKHTVVLFGFAPDDKVDIGDPSVGREQWAVEGVRVLWHGEGMRLVPREG